MDVAPLDHVAIDTELVISMPAHEMDCGKFQLFVATAAVLLLAKVSTATLHRDYVVTHLLNSFCHLLYAWSFNFIAFVNFTLEVSLYYLLLVFELLGQERRKDLKLDVCL